MAHDDVGRKSDRATFGVLISQVGWVIEVTYILVYKECVTIPAPVALCANFSTFQARATALFAFFRHRDADL
jgi:hypothetical protein